MKPIKDMSVDEMKAEIRSFLDNKYYESEPYAFISYSHLDAELVYSKVLGWVRGGYNLYIDLDFENHASNFNWVDLMKSKLKNINCVQIIAFRSINHAFSYASFMELQYSRSKALIDYLEYMGYAPMDIDIINIGDLPIRPWSDMDKKDKREYISRFDKLREKMGSYFCEKNSAERELMNDLLNEWNAVPNSQNSKRMSVLQQLDDSYRNGAVDFYSMIYGLTNSWLQSHDLIGNYKDINSDMSKRLEKVKLDDYEEIETEKPEKIEAAAVESKATEIKKSAPKAEKVITKAEKPEPKAEINEAAKKKTKITASVIAEPIGAAVVNTLLKNDETKATNEGAYPRYYVYSGKKETYDCCVKQSGENEYFIVAGTKMALEHASYCQDKKLREEIIASGAVEVRGDKYVFIRDYAVKGLSKAGNAITGKSYDANKFWQKSELPEGYTASAAAADDGAIRNIVSRILDEYIIAKEEPQKGHPLGEYFRNEIPAEIYASGLVDEKAYLVKGSVGNGNWAAVPWVCVFDRNITNSATKGVYIVYLLAKDCQTLYLTFNQGCTDIRSNNSKKETIRIMRENAKYIAAQIDSRGFADDEDINLGDNLTELAELYQKGTIFYKAYRKGAVPSDAELRSDLMNMMDIYKEYADKF